VSALARLAARLDTPLLIAALATSGLKVASAALNYGLLVLLARTMAVEAFGLYGMMFSAAVLIASGLSFGQPVFVLKSIPEYGARRDPARQKGAVFFGAMVILALSALFLIAIGVAFFGGILPDYLMNVRLVLAFGALTVIYAVSDYTCNLLRALGRTFAGLAPRDIVWRLTAVLGVALLARRGTADLFPVLLLLAVLLALAVAWQLWLIGRIIGTTLSAAPLYDTERWRGAAVWMAIGSILFAVSTTIDTVIVGSLMGAEDAAVYFSASRTAGVSSLLLVGLRLVAAPVFAGLHYAEEPEKLRSRIEMTYGLSCLTAAAVALAAFAFAPQIMAIFGAGYAGGVGPFRILLLGFAVATGGGMSSSILESTGGERLNARILLVTQSATALAVAAGALTAGLYGAAIAKALGIAFEAVWLTFCVFRRLPARRSPSPGAP
jgi:O-antigen/teichoic acid export membrane protein